MAVRTFTDGAGTLWTVWAVRPQTRERRSGADRRSGRDRRAGSSPRPVERRSDRRVASDRRAASDRRLTPRSRAIILPGLEQGWLCFEAGTERRRLAPIPPDWEAVDTRTLVEYLRGAALTRPSSRSA